MKIPLSWIKDFLPLDRPLSEITEGLTLAGLEVEKITKTPLNFEGVVVATIRKTEKHPNAESLTIATVFDGQEELQIVCGAPNCRPGIKTALARIGGTLIDASGEAWKIKRTKLRGIESFGMLCSGKELSLTEDAEGIMELSLALKEGTPLADLYSDTVLEIGLTPNLGHCMSILGIARELSAIFELPLKEPSISLKETSDSHIQEWIQVKVDDPELCPQYSCRLVQGISVGASPEWMQRRLEAAGMRSINNVVDIGNFVMLELGLPLHMFDYDKLSGKEILLSAKSSHRMLKTLDEEIREIPQHALLILDREKPIAIAGIMGSEGSAVSETTKTLLIEAAQFQPTSIRKTSKQLLLRTESSQRFEREIDPNAVLKALNRAAALLQEYAGGAVVQGVCRVTSGEEKPRKIALRMERVNKILGTTLHKNEILSLLQRLSIMPLHDQEERVDFSIPSYRNDLKLEIDLIEEIARLYGFNRIVEHQPEHLNSSIAHASLYLLERRVREHLIALGLQETLNCDLISPRLSELTSENGSSAISVLHPTSIEQSILRRSLLPGLLQVVRHNLDHQNPNLHLFEVGRIHFKSEETFIEQTTAAIALCGSADAFHWNSKSVEVDFYDLKGKVEDLLSLMHIEKVEFERSHLHNFHPLRQARIKVGRQYIGALGEIHPTHLKELEISKRLYFAEINLDDLRPLLKTRIKAEKLSPYPGSERDWTLSLKENAPIGSIIQAIEEDRPAFLEEFLLLSLYKSEKIGKDKKNATFRFLYRDRTKTIEQATVEKAHKKLTQSVEKKLQDYLL